MAPLPRTSPRSRRSPRAEEPDGPSGPGAEDFVWEQIGKVALLNAEEKAQLAKRVEAGLYAAERVRRAEDVTDKLSPQLRRDLRSIVCGGHCATNHLLEANCGWSCRWPSATPAAAA